MSRWFVTGTDTEIGKTVTTACLAAALAENGGDAWAAKPLASGVEPGTVGEDAQLLSDATGHPPLVHTTWTAPLSPHRAAILENKPLDIPNLQVWLSQLPTTPGLVEGVGGWRVPLAVRSTPPLLYEVSDLARDAGGKIILVAPNQLGVLNHTRLTVEAIRGDGHTVVGVVLNAHVSGPTSASTATNLDDLRLLLDLPVATLPRLTSLTAPVLAAAGRRLWSTLGFPPPV